MIVAVPFADNAVVDEVSVIVDPVGARSGTFSQATAERPEQLAQTTRSDGRGRHVNI